MTKAFNLNLLQRINDELGADFTLEQFDHIAEYDEVKGEARSYLKSKIDQIVEISSLGQSFEFKANETIHTEISQKYDDEKLMSLIDETQLVLKKKFTDTKRLLCRVHSRKVINVQIKTKNNFRKKEI